MRLDLFLVETGAYASRARARAAIEAGLVRVNGVVASKPAQTVAPDNNVVAEGEAHPFVSRGGVKLDAALRTMEIAPAGKICLDLGASTGGFTDVLLRADAAKVYAVDVGHGQLHETLVTDPRVVNLEKTHAKDLTRALIPDPIEVIVCDVSFISLKKALPPALALVGPAGEGAQTVNRPSSRSGAQLIALIKPQFEVGPEGLGKGGLVKEGLADAAAQEIAGWVEKQGWRTIGLTESPIKGGDGNREFLIGAVKSS